MLEDSSFGLSRAFYTPGINQRNSPPAGKVRILLFTSVVTPISPIIFLPIQLDWSYSKYCLRALAYKSLVEAHLIQTVISQTHFSTVKSINVFLKHCSSFFRRIRRTNHELRVIVSIHLCSNDFKRFHKNEPIRKVVIGGQIYEWMNPIKEIHHLLFFQQPLYSKLLCACLFLAFYAFVAGLIWHYNHFLITFIFALVNWFGTKAVWQFRKGQKATFGHKINRAIKRPPWNVFVAGFSAHRTKKRRSNQQNRLSAKPHHKQAVFSTLILEEPYVPDQQQTI